MLGGGGLGGGGGDGGGGAHTLGRWRLGGSAALSPDPLGRSALATTPTTAQSSLGKWQSPDLLRWPPERSSTPRSRCASRKIPLQASSRIVSRLTKKMKWQRERTRGIWTGRSMIPNSNHCAAPLALPHLAPPHLARLQQSICAKHNLRGGGVVGKRPHRDRSRERVRTKVMAWKSGARARLCPLGSPHHEYGRLLVQGRS